MCGFDGLRRALRVVNKPLALKLAHYTNKIHAVNTAARENRSKNHLARHAWSTCSGHS